MTKKIKLSEKQLGIITQIQSKKQELTNAFQELNQKEGMVIELVLEMNNVTEQVKDVKLEEGHLVVTTEEQVEKKKGKMKVSPKDQDEDKS